MSRSMTLIAFIGTIGGFVGCNASDRAAPGQRIISGADFLTRGTAGEAKPDLELASLTIDEPKAGVRLDSGKMSRWRATCRTKPGVEFRHRVEIEIVRGDSTAGGGTLVELEELGEGVYQLSGEAQAPIKPGAYEARAVAIAMYRPAPGPEGQNLDQAETVRSASETIKIEVVP